VKNKGKIIFIGTGGAKTSLSRFHSSFIISNGNYNLLVDTGDGNSKAFLRHSGDFRSIDGIVFSHLHPDHFSGFAALILQMKFAVRIKPLSIFAHDKLIPVIKNFLIQTYIFPERAGFEIQFTSFNDNDNVEINDGFGFTSRANTHLDDYKKDGGKYNLKLSSSSFLFTVNGKKIFFTGDMGGNQDLSIFDDQKFNLMISEITHAGLDEIIKSFKNSAAGKLFLTHISDEDDQKIEMVKSKLSKKDQKKIIFAFDGMEITL
jgi:ribonuclease BN (tRNA processing enzyme)